MFEIYLYFDLFAFGTYIVIIINFDITINTGILNNEIFSYLTWTLLTGFSIFI